MSLRLRARGFTSGYLLATAPPVQLNLSFLSLGRIENRSWPGLTRHREKYASDTGEDNDEKEGTDGRVKMTSQQAEYLESTAKNFIQGTICSSMLFDQRILYF